MFNTVSKNSEETTDYKGQLFVGIVRDEHDPLDTGRTKVTVDGLLDAKDTPYVGQVRYSPFGQGPGFGMYGQAGAGSVSVVEFQNGDTNFGISHGFLAVAEHVPAEFRGPGVWGYKDPSGNTLRVDMQVGTYTFTHSSGTTYTIDADGNLTANTSGNVSVTVNGNANVSTTGTTTLKSSGATTVEASNILLKATSMLAEIANTVFRGNVRVEGTLTYAGGLFGDNSSGGGHATIVGPITHSGGNLTSNGVVVHTHRHPTPEGDSGAPYPG